MSFSYFTIDQITPLLISCLLIIISIIIFKKNSTLSLVILFIATLCLGYFIANLDHFLNLWDEQYHALVAKNLSKNPFVPSLYYDPVLDFNYKNWTANNIWLHKQPLFLWQMAFFIKIFGPTELAIRIPSIIMHAIIPVFIYRIGKIAINNISAYYGALLFAVAYFPLELIVGGYSTDHNDIAFLFYVTASFWSWFEYNKSKKTYWLILIGIFSGCAVLVKWLMGLLVYFIWIATRLFSDFHNLKKHKSYLPMLFSVVISLIVFLPWFIYIRLTFPKEALYEFSLNAKHFFEPIEGHTGNIWFHLTDGLRALYGSGDAIPILLLAGITLMLIRSSKIKYRLFIASTILFVYTFFSFAATKMIGFTLIATPFIYLGLGTLIYEAINLITKKIKSTAITTLISITLPLVIAFSALNLNRIHNYHTMMVSHNNRNRANELAEMAFIHSLNSKLPDSNYVIFNAQITVNGHIPIMYYTEFVAYNHIPTPEQIRRIREAGKKVAVVNLGNLPEYIISDDEVIILNFEDFHNISSPK